MQFATDTPVDAASAGVLRHAGSERYGESDQGDIRSVPTPEAAQFGGGSTIRKSAPIRRVYDGRELSVRPANGGSVAVASPIATNPL